MIALVRVTAPDTDASHIGWVCLAAGDHGIAACTLPQPTAEAALAQLDDRLAAPARGDALLARAGDELRRYFAGERVALDLPLDLSDLPDFTRRVLRAVARIPYGETRSYGQIARAAARPGAARAVGQAVARNPLALIVPCHRVIGSGGALVGFGGGLDVKRRLLDMERRGPTRAQRMTDEKGTTCEAFCCGGFC
jgi:methylated-DNA-[protein]-cysteine S-methyltransferase